MADLRRVLCTAIDRVGLSLHLSLALDVGMCLLEEDVEPERESFHRVIASERRRALAGEPALVPALVARTLSAADGVLALASMLPKDRLLAGLTPRVAFLLSLLVVLDGRKGTSGRSRSEALASRM